ncbi:hypothetical protein CEUSTIGMA_g12985.t1 [Chlamydomonas eustigma]|uniref:Helicase ATP-binding domain-containing protein n=1 Tax=Chlamydomonas eustigma TaxID=1157962 RepID=A0A250XRZ6_9CHLO|nr:hypothetical protein CEUSTIGMA_g12985.t1 [Chlamydomonas eustigma]|eukprot:GAX85570.1 hypothetical protein CEUSTIGMA_g12985.t1 [Chlamydomonas eustigma]
MPPWKLHHPSAGESQQYFPFNNNDHLAVLDGDTQIVNTVPANTNQGLQAFYSHQAGVFDHDSARICAMDPEGQGAFASDDDAEGCLRAVRNLPNCFQKLYKSFRYFNMVQSECYSCAYLSDENMVISAPTGSGKTGVMELSLLRLLSKQLDEGGTCLVGKRGAVKAVYIAPLRALCQEKLQDWSSRFGIFLGLNCVELTGDTEPDPAQMESADIICTTPEKFDSMTRKLNEKGGATFFSEIGLVMIDEVHLLGESGRGSALEAGVVSRIKMVSQFPDMAQFPLGHVRFVAVSATIPNVGDIAQWLHVDPALGLKQFGEEARPVKLKTVVRSFRATKNDFMFEKLLSGYLPPIISEFSKGKPTLIFCSSRKGTLETAQHLVSIANHTAGSNAAGVGPSFPNPSQHNSRNLNTVLMAGNKKLNPHQATMAGRGLECSSPYIRDRQHQEILTAAARQMQNAKLADVVTSGVGIHSAGLDGEDRALVEKLFLSGDLLVLCTTSTLALGVNLPAHLVIIKGTRRYCGNDAESGYTPCAVGTASSSAAINPAGTGSSTAALSGSTYKEYDRSVCLQMVGRAGRPQFDTEGVAVIMTQTNVGSSY